MHGGIYKTEDNTKDNNIYDITPPLNKMDNLDNLHFNANKIKIKKHKKKKSIPSSLINIKSDAHIIQETN